MVNYILGTDPEMWKFGVRTFGKVRYANVYPGIDLEYYGDDSGLEYDFVVAPGADPSLIHLDFVGVETLTTDESGRLLLNLGDTSAIFLPPVVYQELNGKKVPIEGAYRLAGNSVSFTLGEYDQSRTLVIDPILVYGTYLGGSGDDYGRALALDSDGSVYVTGESYSNDFSDSSWPGEAPNVFVLKLDPEGTDVLYETYLGGDGIELAQGIAVDATSSAYITGRTGSTNFPTTEHAFQTAPQGGTEVFVVKLDPTGALSFSTLLGGSGNDEAQAIAVDATGNTYLTGSTNSNNFPSTGGPSYSGATDAFVAKLSPDGTNLVYGTYLGGDSLDQGFALELDSTGSAYVAGSTDSEDFPTTGGALSQTIGSGTDAFVAKLSPDGTTLAYSTFLGGNGPDLVRGLAIDSEGAAYLTGQTQSTDFPTTTGPELQVGGDAFLCKLNPGGSDLVYSTLVGGSDFDIGFDLALDSEAGAFLTGQTFSQDFPTTDGSENRGGSDAFIAKFDAVSGELVYSTLLGGSEEDSGQGLAVDQFGAAYVAGLTLSSDFPSTGNSISHGLFDVFVAKVAIAGAQVSPSSQSKTRPPGSTAHYFATVTNSGGVVDRFDLSLDGDFPAQLSPAAVGPLEPGQSESVVVVVEVPAEAVAETDDLQTLIAKSQLVPDTFGSAALHTRVETTFGVAASPDEQTGLGTPESEVVYHFTVTNLGNTDDTFNLTVSSPFPVLPSHESLNLQAFESAALQLTVTVPDQTLVGTSNLAQVTVRSQGDSSRQTDLRFHTEVVASMPGVALVPNFVENSGAPGSNVSCLLLLTNNTEVVDTFIISVTEDTFSAIVLPAEVELEPGESTSLIIQVQVPENQPAGSLDTVVLNAVGQASQAAGSAGLRTSVQAVHQLQLTPSLVTGASAPGEAVSHTFFVTNTGNDSDSFQVSVDNLGFSANPSTTTIGPLDSASTGQVELTVTIPAGTPAGSMGRAILTLTSQGNPNRTASAEAVTTVSGARALGLSFDRAGATVSPASVARYALSITNNGSLEDRYILQTEGGGFPLSLSSSALGPIAPGATEIVSVEVIVPAGALGGETSLNSVHVVSLEDPDTRGQVEFETTAALVYRPEVSPQIESRSADAGQMAVYGLTITNEGNVPDRFEVRLAGNLFPTVSSVQFTEVLSPGQSESVRVSVSVPNQALGGVLDTVMVNVHSQGEPEQVHSAALTTSVRAYEGSSNFLNLAFTHGSARPGESVVYQVTVTNTSGSRQAFDFEISGHTFPTLLSQASVGPLDPGSSADVTVTVQVPEGAMSGNSSQVLLRATNSAGQRDMASLVTDVVPAPPGQISLTYTQGEFLSTGATYSIELANAGPYLETVAVSIRLINPLDGRQALNFQSDSDPSFQSDLVLEMPANPVELAPGTKVRFTVHGSYGDSASYGEYELRAVSLRDPQVATALKIIHNPAGFGVQDSRDPFDPVSSKSCFIATAAYGSPLEPQVLALREFRNRYLLTNSPGRRLVSIYYRYSPPAAQWISQRNWARVAARVVLFPICALAWIFSLLGPKGLLSLLFLGLLYLSRRRLRRRLP